MKFADALKALRKEKGLSQQQLADMIYVNRSSVTRWESGIRMPDTILMNRLSKCLDFNIFSLLSEDSDDLGIPNIIVVDDERLFLSSEMKMLESVLPDAFISGFTRPSEALEYAKANKIALAILDIEIGNTLGFDLCKSLLEINPHTNVIYLTAYSDYSLKAWDTGACGFIVKPVTKDALRSQFSHLRYPVRGIVLND